MHRVLACIVLGFPASVGFLASAAHSHTPPLLPSAEVAALVEESSGETAKRNLEGIARFHRQRGSAGFDSAATLIATQARAYGLHAVEVLKFPTDGATFYGTQRSRPGWDAESATLVDVSKPAAVTLASYAAQPVVLAEDSESADVTAELVDVGSGTLETDYAGKEIKGRIVLVSAQPGEAQTLAIGRFGAVGMVSYAQNQKTAWSGDNSHLVRWGHLNTFSPYKTFAFMISRRTATELQQRLHQGEPIRLHATVDAQQHPSSYEIVTATIPGTDPQLKEQEIAFSCHLDHQRPGANDNASGCVTILEAARSLQTLIARGVLKPPGRTLRFIWPPEIEGTITLLNARPDFAARIKAVIHMDMVGGNDDTQAVFHVTRGPQSLPSFVHDVAWAFADWTNQESYDYAATGVAEYPMVAPEGSAGPLRAEYSPYSMGSDHDVYQDSSFAIPAIYMNDWPDRYIHTNDDVAAHIDPTKLKRAAIIGAASGYFLANYTPRHSAAVEQAIEAGGLRRREVDLRRQVDRKTTESYERAIVASAASFPARQFNGFSSSHSTRGAARRFKRQGPRGPLAVFGYDYLTEHLDALHASLPKLLAFEGPWAGGEAYAYEALNFADGRHTTQQIADALTAELGPVPLELVSEYLEALQRIDVVK